MGNYCFGSSSSGSSGPSSKSKAGVSDEDKQKIADAFQLYDTNRDGTIQTVELVAVLQHFLGKTPTDTQVQRIMDQVDENKNGTIEYNEFEKMMTQRTKKKKQHYEVFKKYDLDHNGLITRDELTRVLNREGNEFTENEIQEIVKAADADQDGMINYEEFMAYFC